MELLYAHSVEIGGVALLAFFALSGAATRSLRASLSAQDRAPTPIEPLEPDPAVEALKADLKRQFAIEEMRS